MTLDNKQIQQKRAEAQTLKVTLQLGKAGITDAAITELDGQLRKHRLVKVRLLPSATSGQGTTAASQADNLRDATSSTLIDVRGSTAVFYR